jgi:hypothetical protein
MSSKQDAATMAQVQKDQLDQLRIENERYMRNHPEFNKAIQDFVYEVLKRKPENIQTFAVDFFGEEAAKHDH